MVSGPEIGYYFFRSLPCGGSLLLLVLVSLFVRLYKRLKLLFRPFVRIIRKRMFLLKLLRLWLKIQPATLLLVLRLRSGATSGGGGGGHGGATTGGGWVGGGPSAAARHHIIIRGAFR